MGRHRGKGRGPPRRPTDSPQDPATHPSVHMATRRESRTGTDPHSHADESKRGPRCVSTTKGGRPAFERKGMPTRATARTDLEPVARHE